MGSEIFPQGTNPIPETDLQQSLGSPTNRWKNIFTENVIGTDAGVGSWYDIPSGTNIIVPSGQNMIIYQSLILDGTVDLNGRLVDIPLNNVSSSGTVSTVSNSGTGFPVYNSQNGNNIVFNTISGNGTITVTYQNGLINFSGSSFNPSGYLPLIGGTLLGDVQLSGSNIYPTISGTETIGILAQPVSGVYAKTMNTGAVLINVWNEVPSGLINNSNKVYTLAFKPYIASNAIQLFKAGSYQALSGVSGIASFDYSLSGSTITMVSAPTSGTNLLANYAYAIY